MSKFYVTDTKHNLILERPNQRLAAEAFANYWHERKIELGNVIGMNEVGFQIGQVDTDSIFNTSEILTNIK